MATVVCLELEFSPSRRPPVAEHLENSEEQNAEHSALYWMRANCIRANFLRVPERGPIADLKAHTGVNGRPSAGGLEIARHLLERETAVAPESSENGAALERTLERTLARVSENLRRSVGDDGYEALLARAVARTQSAHPALVDIHSEGIAGFSMDRVTASVDTHGAAVVTAALESLVATLVDVLSGLIGADMVMNLLDPDGLLPKTPQPRQPK